MYFLAGWLGVSICFIISGFFISDALKFAGVGLFIGVVLLAAYNFLIPYTREMDR